MSWKPRAWLPPGGLHEKPSQHGLRIEDRPGGTVYRAARRRTGHHAAGGDRELQGKQSARLPAGAAELSGLSFGAVRAVSAAVVSARLLGGYRQEDEKDLWGTVRRRGRRGDGRLPGEDVRCRACGGRRGWRLDCVRQALRRERQDAFFDTQGNDR